MSKQELKKAGLKATLPRMKILEIMEQSDNHHMSAEDVHKALLDADEDCSLATVYRVLSQFEAAHIVVRHNFEEDHAVFELNRGDHHDHLVCIQCGRVDEFYDNTIEKRQEAVAHKAKFHMTNHSLCIYGICDLCYR